MASKKKMEDYDKYVESHRPNDMMVYRKKLSCAALCTKRALFAMNLIIVIFAIILIAIGGYVVQSTIADITTKGVPAGIIVMGIFLLFISVLGCIAAGKENKRLLGWYAIALFLILLIQIILAIVLLTNGNKAESWVSDGWYNASAATQADLMNTFSCCGLNNVNDTYAKCPNTAWPPCLGKLKSEFEDHIIPLGAVSITFAFLQMCAVLCALCLRVGVASTEAPAPKSDDNRTASRY